MTKETIDYVTANKRFKMTFEDYLNYFVLIAPLAIALIGYAMLSAYFRSKSNGNLLFPAICAISLGLFSIYYALRRLIENISFTSVPLNNDFDLDVFCQKLKAEFKKAQIYPAENLNAIVVVTPISAFSWGEKVTIILEKGEILINSQPCGTQPITILKDSLNIKRVKRLVEGM